MKSKDQLLTDFIEDRCIVDHLVNEYREAVSKTLEFDSYRLNYYFKHLKKTIMSFLKLSVVIGFALFISSCSVFEGNDSEVLEKIAANEQEIQLLQSERDSLLEKIYDTNRVVNALIAENGNFQYWINPIANEVIEQSALICPIYFLNETGDSILYSQFQGKTYPSLTEFKKVVKYLDDKYKRSIESETSE